MRFLVFFAAVFSLSTGASSVYVCTDSYGKKSFQQRPCKGAAKSEVKTLKIHQPAVGAHATGGGGRKLATDSAIYKEMRYNRKLAKMKREIAKSEGYIAKLEASMERELYLVKRKKRFANNNLAGATWEESLSSEMQAISSKYASKINAERDTLKRLRERYDKALDDKR